MAALFQNVGSKTHLEWLLDDAAEMPPKSAASSSSGCFF